MTPTRSQLLLVVAAVLFAIAALIGFGVFHSTHEDGWIAAGLLAFVLTFLIPAAP